MMRGTPDFLDKHMSAPTQPSAMQQSAPAPAVVGDPEHRTGCPPRNLILIHSLPKHALLTFA